MPRPTTSVLALLVAASVSAAASCGGGAEVATLDRETFVATYVDLRAAGVGQGRRGITPEQRAAILDRHGVTEEQLLDFARIRGGDPSFMEGVWEEVDARLAEEGGEQPGPPEDPPG